MAGVDEVVVVTVRDGEIADMGSWVYVWCRATDDRRVVYVGATGLAPATRVWLHLHDPDPAVGRVSALFPSVKTDPLDVVALCLPPGLPRPDVKAAVIAELSQRGLLAADYVGDPPAASAAGPAPEIVGHAQLLIEEVAQRVADALA